MCGVANWEIWNPIYTTVTFGPVLISVTEKSAEPFMVEFRNPKEN